MHLKTHDITPDEYKNKFPNAKIYSEECIKNQSENKFLDEKICYFRSNEMNLDD